MGGEVILGVDCLIQNSFHLVFSCPIDCHVSELCLIISDLFGPKSSRLKCLQPCTYSLNHQLMGLKLRLHQRDQTPAAASHVFPTGLDDFLRSDPSSGSIGDRSKITGSSKRSCRLDLLSSARSHISFGPCRSSKEASSLQTVCSHQRG